MMQTLLLVLGSLVVGILAGWLRGTPPNVSYVRVPPPVDDALAPPRGARDDAAGFVRELVGFTERLAARDLCVRKLSCGPSWFWELVLQPGAEADQAENVGQSRFTRVFWSVREDDVSVESSSFLPELVSDIRSPGSPASTPTDEQVREIMARVNPWTPESRTKIGRTGDAIGVAEDLLIRRFSGGAGTNPGPA